MYRNILLNNVVVNKFEISVNILKTKHDVINTKYQLAHSIELNRQIGFCIKIDSDKFFF